MHDRTLVDVFASNLESDRALVNELGRTVAEMSRLSTGPITEK